MKTLEKNDGVVKLLKDMYSDLKAEFQVCPSVIFFFLDRMSASGLTLGDALVLCC